jgi:hypothetical protein
MIYKLIVNAAFLAIGYYIGKEVGMNAQAPKRPTNTEPRPRKPVVKKPNSQS